MISVVIPLYNKEVYIKNTIENVLNQSYQDFEIIVVNDGSSDNGPNIVKEFNDSRVKLIDKINGGVSSARNLGISKAKYDYIAFLDADDKWLPNHLDEISKLIFKYKDKADVFVTNFGREYSNGDIIDNRKKDELCKGIVDNYFEVVMKKAIIHTSCVCIAKKVFDIVEGFDTRLTRGEDMDLWFRVTRMFKVAYSPVVTELYLQEAENSCSFELPDPEFIYAYYIDFNVINDKYDYKIHKSILRKRQLRYFILDNNFKGGVKLLKKQWKNLL
ncbi:glycosyltransferase family 2 protein [Myroides odoratimimus]|uniref:glycosyltransferase family 2 protein n=1 Tax=Myroides odoratimimus TaxID=76832 RepID=UPI002578D9E5|nr:glycosyltransferase family A protein [Myroides odoratimimus]MDM1454777.1 glycosyltransferase family 2 protein [Myroides odoratimimus]MDM1478500.1 glycosyltransferase family 2 protein [Myroides odoratimimus]MDM1490830.1 glycosyltransferase family 2 protein [Myroides odoratimimus]